MAEERRELTKPEGAAKPGVVAKDRVGIQREVGAVDGEVAVEEKPELLVAGAGPGVGWGPEEAMVDDEQVGPGGDGASECGASGVDGGGDTRHVTIIVDLQAIGGAVIVVEPGDAEESVAVAGEGGERGGFHG
jgi:hypothetical protein